MRLREVSSHWHHLPVFLCLFSCTVLIKVSFRPDLFSLSEVIRFNQRLNEELEQFVRKHTTELAGQREPGVDLQRHARANELQLPSVNLVFANGRLARFD